MERGGVATLTYEGLRISIFLKDGTPGKLYRNSSSSLDQQANDSLREQ